MDPFRHDNGYYPPHQSYGYPQAPPHGYPPHQSYPQAPPHGYPPHQSYGYPQAPPSIVNNYNYALPPNYSQVMHPGFPNAMPPTLPGYPHNPTPGAYPIHQPWQNHWQPPEAHPGTPHGFDAYGHQAAWPEQSVEPDQGWTNENDNSSHRQRDIDVIEVKRNVLPPPPKDLPAKPQHLAAKDSGGSTAQTSVPSPKTPSMSNNTLEQLSPISTSTKTVPVPNPRDDNLDVHVSSKDSGGSTAQTSVPSPKTPSISNNTRKQLSPISTSTKNVPVPNPRDDNLHVDTEESPNLAPFEMDQQYTGDTFRLLTAKTIPPPGRVLIGPDHRRSKPPIEASTQVIVAIIHSETQKHWSGIKITIYESSVAGYYFDSLKSNREGRAREVQSSYEEQLQTWFQQVGMEKQAKMDLTIMDSLNQNDGTSCGPYVWYFVECALKDEESTMKTIPSIELRKQQKALVLSTLQVSENVNSPEKSENTSEISELHHNGTVPLVSPVKRPRSSIQPQATTQSKIPESWRQGSKEQQSRPAKRPVSASFSTVKTRKKTKPTSRKGKRWTADELKILNEEISKGKPLQYIADLLGRPVNTCAKRLRHNGILWVPRSADVKLMWSLVIEQNIVSHSAIQKRFPDTRPANVLEVFNKVKYGYALENIPTVPGNFFTRIRKVKKDERFEHKEGRGIVYPGKSSEAFEYRWIDNQLIIIDTANLLINTKPLLVWYPYIDKLWFIRPSCYAVVDNKISKWFSGEWVSLVSAFRIYVLSGHWNDDFQDLVLFDKDGERRQTYNNIVRVFKDDNGQIMCSLCNLAFTSRDSYLLHAGLHEDGWPNMYHCCLSTIHVSAPVGKRQRKHNCPHHQKAEVGLFENRPVHGPIDNLLNFQGDLDHGSAIDHKWDLIAYSVRWSSHCAKVYKHRFNENIEDLVKAYETSYTPTSGKVIKSPFVGSSSRCPIFTTPERGQKLGFRNNFFHQIYEMKPSSRILIMSQSIDGLTTNLQSLVFFARSMEHLHITLGFCLPRPKRLVSFGQKVKENRGWVFYNLQTLRKNITGAGNNPRYMRLITALFVIQKYKQGQRLRPEVDHHTLGSGPRRNTVDSSSDVIAMLGADGEDGDGSSVGDNGSDGDDASDEDKWNDEYEDSEDEEDDSHVRDSSQEL